MPATLAEQIQWLDSSGAPLVSGKVYFGDQNADPVANPQDIFADRALTTPIDNPQTLDANGRTTDKVWIAGRYSIRVDNLNDVQQYQELDNGETVSTGVTQLENVVGANVITATATTTITAYTDLEQFVFRTVATNTAPTTLNIDSVGAKFIVKNRDQPLVFGDLRLNQNVIVSFNETNDNFEWVNHNNTVVQFSEGTAVASAATADIWATDGNTLHLTGNTGPVTSFGTAPNVGARRRVICDSNPTFTQSTNLNLQGGVDFTAEAGDVLEVYADTLTQFDILISKIDGTNIVVGANQIVQLVNTQVSAISTGTTQIPEDNTIPQITEGDEYMTLAITPNDTANILIIDVVISLDGNAATNQRFTAALFQDSTADALAAMPQAESSNTTDVAQNIFFRHQMAAGTTSSTTFRVRAGMNLAGTTRFNPHTYGGTQASSITITEYTA